MKIFRFLLTLLLCLTPLAAKAMPYTESSALEDVAAVRRHLTCAWASLAARRDKAGSVARDQLADKGWNVSAIENDKESKAAHYLLEQEATADHGRRYLLIFPDTVELREAEEKIEFQKAAFADGSVDEGTALAPKENMPPLVPQVHRGYNHYTKKTFFTNGADGHCFGDDLVAKLTADPTAELWIAGHSRSAAVAILFAARLSDLGLEKNRYKIVTFAAPAVGNDTFCRYYVHAIDLTRFAMQRETVAKALQPAANDYNQFGIKMELPRPRNMFHTASSMISYLDAILRRYYDKAAESAPLPAVEGVPTVYMAPVVFDMEKYFADDFQYIDLALRDTLGQKLPGIKFADSTSQPLAASMSDAELAGCRFVLVNTCHATRIQNKATEHYRMSLDQQIIEASTGALVFYQEVSIDTQQFTPIEAFICNNLTLNADRQAALDRAIASGSNRGLKMRL